MSIYVHTPDPHEQQATHLRDIAKRIEPVFPSAADELRGIAHAIAERLPDPAIARIEALADKWEAERDAPFGEAHMSFGFAQSTLRAVLRGVTS